MDVLFLALYFWRCQIFGEDSFDFYRIVSMLTQMPFWFWASRPVERRDLDQLQISSRITGCGILRRHASALSLTRKFSRLQPC